MALNFSRLILLSYIISGKTNSKYDSGVLINFIRNCTAICIICIGAAYFSARCATGLRAVFKSLAAFYNALKYVAPILPNLKRLGNYAFNPLICYGLKAVAC